MMTGNKVLLIDADSTIPNLALMKLSMYHKSIGDIVEFIKFSLPYYPNKKKFICNVPDNYDIKYCSVIFDGNKDYIIGENIEFGGTGCNLKKKLPDHIEKLKPDYSLYPENDISYGFISRGCIRNCSFCKVPEKEGCLHQVNNVDDIVYYKKVKFLDNNFLALENHKIILRELIKKNIKCQFNQGLDIRLLDNENSKLLSELNYLGDYIFAFDNIKYKNLIKDKLRLLNWRKDFQLKFFVYVNPEMELSDTINRIEFLKENKCLPYIMRDITCWRSKNKDFYTDISAWCNQPNIFKKMSFDTFLNKRYNNIERIKSSMNLYYKM